MNNSQNNKPFHTGEGIEDLDWFSSFFQNDYMNENYSEMSLNSQNNKPSSSQQDLVPLKNNQQPSHIYVIAEDSQENGKNLKSCYQTPQNTHKGQSQLFTPTSISNVKQSVSKNGKVNEIESNSILLQLKESSVDQHIKNERQYIQVDVQTSERKNMNIVDTLILKQIKNDELNEYKPSQTLHLSSTSIENSDKSCSHKLEQGRIKIVIGKSNLSGQKSDHCHSGNNTAQKEINKNLINKRLSLENSVQKNEKIQNQVILQSEAKISDNISDLNNAELNQKLFNNQNRNEIQSIVQTDIFCEIHNNQQSSNEKDYTNQFLQKQEDSRIDKQIQSISSEIEQAHRGQIQLTQNHMNDDVSISEIRASKTQTGRAQIPLTTSEKSHLALSQNVTLYKKLNINNQISGYNLEVPKKPINLRRFDIPLFDEVNKVPIRRDNNKNILDSDNIQLQDCIKIHETKMEEDIPIQNNRERIEQSVKGSITQRKVQPNSQFFINFPKSSVKTEKTIQNSELKQINSSLSQLDQFNFPINSRTLLQIDNNHKNSTGDNKYQKNQVDIPFKIDNCHTQSSQNNHLQCFPTKENKKSIHRSVELPQFELAIPIRRQKQIPIPPSSEINNSSNFANPILNHQPQNIQQNILQKNSQLPLKYNNFITTSLFNTYSFYREEYQHQIADKIRPQDKGKYLGHNLNSNSTRFEQQRQELYHLSHILDEFICIIDSYKFLNDLFFQESSTEQKWETQFLLEQHINLKNDIKDTFHKFKRIFL